MYDRSPFENTEIVPPNDVQTKNCRVAISVAQQRGNRGRSEKRSSPSLLTISTLAPNRSPLTNLFSQQLTMKVSLPLLLATISATAEARSYAGGILTPHRRLARELESSFDLVGEILSTSPIYNLVKQGSLKADSVFPSAPSYVVTHDGENSVALRMELPGVAAEDLEVTLENGALLRIHGKRHSLTGEEMEFDQSFQLEKDVDPESLAVALQNGILQVTASKKAKTTTVKRIQVQTTMDKQATISASSDHEAAAKEEDLTITEDQ